MSQPGTPRLSAVEASKFQMSSFFENRWAPHVSAAAPATCGAAMLVPLLVPYPPPGIVDKTLTPGAVISTSGPRLLNAAITSAESIADTAMTFLYLAGKPTFDAAGGTGTCCWEFPAAATTNNPLFQAASQIVLSAAGADGAPR